MINLVFEAFIAPFRGVKLVISDRKLLALSITPIAIDFVLLFVLGVILLFHIDNLIYAITGHPDSTMEWIVVIFLFVLFGMLTLALCALLFVIIGSILLSPFLEAISAYSEKMFVEVLAEEAGGILQAFKDILRSIKNTLKKLLFIIMIYLVSLPLNLIPIFGSAIYAAISAIISFVLLGWEFLDFAWDRWRWTFKDKREFVRRNLFAVAVLGFSISILLVIPVINLMMMPAATCGATIWAIKAREFDQREVGR